MPVSTDPDPSKTRSGTAQFLLLEQGLGAGIVTALINGGIAWALYQSREHVPLWGLDGLNIDIAMTAFLLPFLFTVIATPSLRRRVADGRLPSWHGRRDQLPIVAKLSTSARKRGAVMGLFCLATVAPLCVAVLNGMGQSELEPHTAIWLKTVFAGVLAMLIGPLIGAAALADPARANVRQL